METALPLETTFVWRTSFHSLMVNCIFMAFKHNYLVQVQPTHFPPKILLILKKNIPLLVFVLLVIVMDVVPNMAVEDEEPYPVDLIVASSVIFQ